MEDRVRKKPPEKAERGAKESGRPLSFITWQSILYLLVIGWICVVLIPLTSLWWIIPVLAVAAPFAYAALENRLSETRPLKKPDKKHMEKELLAALAARNGTSATTAAMHTSLTVDEASKMLDELARKGHLEVRTEDGAMSYALRAHDRKNPPELETEPSNENPSPSLAEPLSEREMEVLALLASGRTNAEISAELFVALGTVKAHINNIYRKLGVKNRAEALARARELRLLA